MKRPFDPARIFRHLPAALLLCALGAQAIRISKTHSNAYDELGYVGAGYSYVQTGRFILDVREHPPLYSWLAGLALSPLRVTMPNGHPPWEQENATRFGWRLLYYSGADPMKILFYARLPDLILALFLGMGVYFWALELFGLASAYAALCLYCFEPSIVTHASFVSLDMGIACFGFFAVLLYERSLERRSRAALCAAGAAFALGLLTNVSSLLVLPSIAFAVAMRIRGRPEERRKTVQDFALFTGLSLTLVVLALEAMGLSPLTYLRTLVYRAGEAGGIGVRLAPNFMMGKVKSGGFLSYYLVAILFKSTLPFLLLLAASVARWPRLGKSAQIWPWLGGIVFCFILVFSVSQKQYGIRYILVIYPFLCVAISSLATEGSPLSPPKKKWALLMALLGWNAWETVSANPHTHAYFNQLAGGPDGGHHWLVESNLDWGQDMPLLRDYLLRHGSPEVITALATDADVDYWIGPHQTLAADALTTEAPYTHVNSLRPHREFLLVSATYAAGYSLVDPRAFDWLAQLKPHDLLAGGIFVYDMTTDPWAQNRIGQIYYGLGQWPLALRECRRAVELEPKNPAGYLGCAKIYSAMGDRTQARAMYAQALKASPPRPGSVP